MKCIICKAETERRGTNQKYCPHCAQKVAAEKQKKWREAHGMTPSDTTRHCQKCGVVVAAYRNYCDKCQKEKRRTYQRDYKRRIRAKG